MQELFAVNLTN